MEDKTKITQILKKIQERDNQEEIEQEEEQKRVLSFVLGEELYSVDTDSVREIIKLKKIFKVPTTPDYIKGVVNLRGEILPVIELSKLLDISGRTDSENARIIITDKGEKLGFLVDFVVDIIYIPLSKIQPPLSTIEKIKMDYFEGEVVLENNRLMSILNVEKLINSEKIQEI